VSSRLAARHIALLEVLGSHEVRFVLVGAVALQVHGFSGETRDVDVTIATDEANGDRIEAALAAIRAEPFLAGERGSAYRTDYGQLEVMRVTDGVGDYDAWMKNASNVVLARGLSVSVGSASDLLLSKEQADREKDREALPWIRAELLAEGKLDAEDVRGPVADLYQEQRDPRLEGVLGPRPTDRRTRGLWDHAAEMITDYRKRWDLPDDGLFLGAIPSVGSRQGMDRVSLDGQLERLGRMLERDGFGHEDFDRDDLERGR
jgi:hypothetical protein